MRRVASLAGNYAFIFDINSGENSKGIGTSGPVLVNGSRNLTGEFESISIVSTVSTHWGTSIKTRLRGVDLVR